MNNPEAMQNVEWEKKILTCCWFMQKEIEQAIEENKGLENAGEYNQKDMQNPQIPVIDANTKKVQTTLQDDGTLIRKSEKGIIKSKKSPEDIKATKYIQDIANQEKLQPEEQQEENEI